MALVSAQYSDSEGELSDGGQRDVNDDDYFSDAPASALRRDPSILPFAHLSAENQPSGGSSGHNTPPPPPRGGRAPSGSPDAIPASLLGSRQPSPKSGGTDSPLVRLMPTQRLKSHGLSGLVSYPGEEEEEEDDPDNYEVYDDYKEKENEPEKRGLDEGLVPDYMDLSSANMSVMVVEAAPPAEGDSNSYADTSAIPPEPQGRCSKALQENIALKYERYLREEMDYNKAIQRKKEFKNPSIYEKLIELTGIYEFGTNYPAQVYDPHFWGDQASYEDLAKAQKVEMDKREEKRRGEGARAKVEFVSGTARKPTSSSTIADTDSKEKKRKSKWDQGAVDGALAASSASSLSLTDVPVAVTSSSVLPVASGTKTTVISAVGGLSKKTKS